MRVLRDEGEIRATVREIVGLLADDRYADALGLFVPQTAGAEAELREGVRTHGTYDESLPPDGIAYRVVPLAEGFAETFERFLRVDLEAGFASAFLPLDGEYGGDVSDLKIEMSISRAAGGFALERIRVRST